LRIALKPACAPATDAVIAWVERHPVRAVLIAVRWEAYTIAMPRAVRAQATLVRCSGMSVI
jgi:hypothetical protein